MSTPTTTFTWAVGTMDRRLSNGAVQTVHYTVAANDGTYESGAYGSIDLDQPEDDSELTPYADLTSEWAINAVKAKLNSEDSTNSVASIEAALDAQITEQKTPSYGTGVPWS